jgi:hypothetical protein
LNEEVDKSFAMTVDRFVAQGMSLSAALELRASSSKESTGQGKGA